MKRTLFLMAILAVLLWVTSCSKDQSAGPTSSDSSELAKAGDQAYTDYEGSEAPGGSQSISQLPQAEVAGLYFFTSRKNFKYHCPGLRVEDFEGSNVPANSVEACSGVFNRQTDNDCYSPGAIKPGITVEALGVGEMVVLTDGFLGISTTVVGPNFFDDDLQIRIQRKHVNAVGMDLLDPFGPTTMDVEIYGVGGILLGTTTVTSGILEPTFWGVVANKYITAIRFTQVSGGGGELVDNVAHGYCKFP